MKKITYFTYEQIEAQALEHYRRYGHKTSFRDIILYLGQHAKGRCEPVALPTGAPWHTLSDSAFSQLLKQLSVMDIFSDEPLTTGMIAAESIIPVSLEAYAILYIANVSEQMHTHDFFEVSYVAAGSCNMIFENESKTLREGDVCIIAPGSSHDVTLDENSLAVSLMLREDTFETTFFKLLTQEDLLASFLRSILYTGTRNANYLLFQTDNSQFLRDSIKDIFMECYVTDSYSNTCIISRIHLFFSLLLRNYSQTISFYEQQKYPGSHQNFAKILQYIQTNFQSVTLDSLAKHFHYNPSYMSWLIKKATGETFTSLLTSLKMNKSSEYLRNTDLKIEEISRLMGYDSPDHFSRKFKQTYGCPPKAYRQRQGADPR